MTSILAKLRRVVAARRVLFDPRARSEWWTRMMEPAAIHQDVTLTFPDRYPRVFGAAQAELGAEGAHRLLSFGCSSGEEVVSLRRYFTNSNVVGAEINRAQLAACRRLPPDPQATFIVSSHESIAANGPYDAIFCMAVFTRRAHTVDREAMTDISRFYPFRHFDDEVGFLVAQLRPGGLLVAEHCLYRIEDSTAAAQLETVGGVTLYPAKGRRFGRDGRVIEPTPVIGRIFRKKA